MNGTPDCVTKLTVPDPSRLVSKTRASTWFCSISCWASWRLRAESPPSSATISGLTGWPSRPPRSLIMRIQARRPSRFGPCDWPTTPENAPRAAMVTGVFDAVAPGVPASVVAVRPDVPAADPAVAPLAVALLATGPPTASPAPPLPDPDDPPDRPLSDAAPLVAAAAPPRAAAKSSEPERRDPHAATTQRATTRAVVRATWLRRTRDCRTAASMVIAPFPPAASPVRTRGRSRDCWRTEYR